MTDVREAVKVLQEGGIVAFATETVWSLSCSAFDEESVQALLELKGRPEGMPLALGCHSWRAAQAWIHSTPLADDLAARFMPGPISLVLNRRGTDLSWLAPGLDTLSIRVPDGDIARRIVDAGGPLVMTSANLHGQPDPVTAADVQAQFPEVLVIGGSVPGVASTIIDARGSAPVVLRTGAIPETDL